MLRINKRAGFNSFFENGVSVFSSQEWGDGWGRKKLDKVCGLFQNHHLSLFQTMYYIHSVSQYLLSPNYVPGTILSSSGVSVKKKKINKNLPWWDLPFSERRWIEKYVSVDGDECYLKKKKRGTRNCSAGGLCQGSVLNKAAHSYEEAELESRPFTLTIAFPLLYRESWISHTAALLPPANYST